MTGLSTRGLARAVAVSAVALLCLLRSSESLVAATAEEMYVEALAHERNLRSLGHALVTSVEWRDAADRYEFIARTYPRSGFGDNALWQAAGLALEAFDREGSEIDRSNGTRLLTVLARDHPRSPLIPRISERLNALTSRARQTAITRVQGITREVFADFVRVTIAVDGEVRYRGERLARPDRLYFDLLRTIVDTSLLNSTWAFEDGDVVRKIRLGRHPENTTRIVLDLNDVESYDVYTLYNPYRLVVDTVRKPASRVRPTMAARKSPGSRSDEAPLGPLSLEKASPPMQTATQDLDSGLLSAPVVEIVDDVAPEDRVGRLSGAVLPTGLEAPTHSLARQLGLKVSSVVIDPGHGGHDPGAQKGGLNESSLVLDVAFRLERILSAEGVSVQLTRREDVYVSLGERAQIANQADADLLLSIHANAALDPNVRGIETYYLGFTDDPVVQTLAVRENATTSDGMHDLDALVQSIAMHDKVAESEVFAGLVQRHLISGVGGIYPTVQDLGVKRAPFMVLIGAEMPSVLTEVSFLTNEKEASFLATGAYREQIASALSTSIMDYQETLRTHPNSTVEND